MILFFSYHKADFIHSCLFNESQSALSTSGPLGWREKAAIFISLR